MRPTFALASPATLLQNAQAGLSYRWLAFPRIPEQVDLAVGPLKLLHHLGRLIGGEVGERRREFGDLGLVGMPPALLSRPEGLIGLRTDNHLDPDEFGIRAVAVVDLALGVWVSCAGDFLCIRCRIPEGGNHPGLLIRREYTGA